MRKKDENEGASKRGEGDHDVGVGDLSEVRKKVPVEYTLTLF